MGGQNTGIFDGEPPRWASNLGLVVEVVAIVWLVRRNARRGEAFLRDHPDLSGR
ncbi:hypothetical protein [Micromonospora ureilytica]|uniref:hypothetical protein n=1 Tax=Micromonospora ureilytica TaxID=709868 RepID=UPI0040392643